MLLHGSSLNGNAVEKSGRGGDMIDLDASIPEHDVLEYTYEYSYAYDSQKEAQANFFSPQATETKARTKIPPNAGEDVEGGMIGVNEYDRANVPHLYRALDTSACPSLGLGSIGSSPSNDSKVDLSHGSGRSAISHSSNNVNPSDQIDNNGSQDLNSGNSVVGGMGGALSDDSGLSFDSESTSEECLDSFQSCREEEENEKDEEATDSQNINGDDEDFKGSKQERISRGEDAERINFNPLKRTPPPEKYSSENVTQSPLVEKSSLQPEQTPSPSEWSQKDKNQESNSNVDSEAHTISDQQNNALTPTTSIENIRIGLTPRLKALQSKIIRESLGGSPVTPGHGSSTSPKNESKNRSPESELSYRLSLTPALKALRSKIYNDTPIVDSFNDNNSQRDLYNPSPNQPNPGIGRVRDFDTIPESKTPTSSDTQSNWSIPGEISESEAKSSLLKSNERLSLTPALKAFRMKMMNSTLSPFDSTPKSQDTSSSPESRPSVSTIATSGGERSARRVIFEEDNSYLGQPKDLSSAKKKINAHSSALVESLRGAAYKRVISITKSRDSLAAKVSKHLEKHEGKGIDGKIGAIEQKNTIDDKHNEASHSQHSTKAILKKDMSESLSYQSRAQMDIRSVKERRRTDPSPRFDSRREKPSSFPRTQRGGMRIDSIKGINSGARNRNMITRTKRKPLTIPKSPLLGARRITKNKGTDKTKELPVKPGAKSTEAPPKGASSSPLGLDFLSGENIQYDVIGEENVKPFTLYSSLRAKERGQFEACRLQNEKLRTEEIKKERERIIFEKYKELGRLREKLR